MSFFRAAVVVSYQGHVITVQVDDVLACKGTGRVNLYLVVDADDTAYVVVDKTYIVGNDKDGHGLVQSVKDIIEFFAGGGIYIGGGFIKKKHVR